MAAGTAAPPPARVALPPPCLLCRPPGALVCRRAMGGAGLTGGSERARGAPPSAGTAQSGKQTPALPPSEASPGPAAGATLDLGPPPENITLASQQAFRNATGRHCCVVHARRVIHWRISGARCGHSFACWWVGIEPHYAIKMVDGRCVVVIELFCQCRVDFLLSQCIDISL